jgi:hypothetical protein
MTQAARRSRLPRSARRYCKLHLFEALESRLLLACQAFLDQNGALIVAGDDTANRIEIVGSEQGVHVTCDGKDHGTFARVAVIKVQASDGDDDVRINNRNGLFNEVAIEVFGERGNDDFSFEVAQASGATRDPRVPTPVFAFDGGAGGDYFQINAGPENHNIDVKPNVQTVQIEDLTIEVRETTTGVDWDFRTFEVEHVIVRAGGGDDEFNVLGPLGTLVQLFGEEGDDRFSLIEEVSVPDPHAENHGLLEDGGEGFDRAIVIGTEVADNIEIRRGAEAGTGEITITDTASKKVRAQISTVDVESLSANGCAGMDTLNVASSPFAELTLDGGEDADTVAIQFGRLNGRVQVDDSGQQGADKLRLLGTDFGEKFELFAKPQPSDGWIAKWEGPDLDADKNEIAIESIEIAHEGWELTDLEAGDGDDGVLMDNTTGLLDTIHWQISTQGDDDLLTVKMRSASAAQPSPQAPALMVVFDGGEGLRDRLELIGTDSGDRIEFPFSFGLGSTVVSWTATEESGDVGSPDGDGELVARILGQRFEVFDLDTRGGDDKFTLTTSDAAELIEILGVQPNSGRPDPLIRGFDRETGELLLEMSVVRTEAIAIDTRDGDDQVVMREPEAPLSDIEWTITTGDGHDTIDAQLGALPEKFHILTGNDDDKVDVTFGGGGFVPPVDPDAPPKEIVVDVGAGVNSVMLDVFGSSQPPPPSDLGDISTQVTLIEVLATISVTGVGLLALLTLFPTGALEMAQAVKDDRAGDTTTNVSLLLDGANLTADVHTGCTSDDIFVGLSPLAESNMALNINSGRANDRIKVDYQQNVGQQSSLQVDTGDGNDEILVQAGVDRAGPVVTQSSYRLGANAGIGDDTILVTFSERISVTNAPPISTQFEIAPGTGDDEVLVTFEHGDINRPFVLGTLWNSSAPPHQGSGQTGGQLSLNVLADDKQVAVDFDLAGSNGKDVVNVDTSSSDTTIFYVIDISGSMGGGSDTFQYAGIDAPGAAVDRTLDLDMGSDDDEVVVGVTNPAPAEGGDDPEQPDEPRRRTAMSLNTRDGDDDVVVDVGANLTELTIDANAGTGNDTARFKIAGSESPRPQDRMSFNFNYFAGTGIDAADVEFANLTFARESHLGVDFAADNLRDTLNLLLRDITIAKGAGLDIVTNLAGRGNDFTSTWDHLTNAGTIDWDVRIGPGKTRFKPLFAFYVADLDGKFNFNQHFTQGSGQTEFVMHDSIIAGDWNWNYHGGTDRHRMFAIIDRTTVRSNVFAVWTTVGFFDVDVRIRDLDVSGVLDVSLQGGAPGSRLNIDAERVNVTGELRWRSDPYAETIVRAVDWLISGIADLVFRGDDAANRYRLDLQTAFHGNGHLAIEVDGRGGNDHMAANLLYEAMGDGLIDMALLGGDGNDLLSLLAFGQTDPQRPPRLFIDGGPGFDIALATAGVEIVNCEVVQGAQKRR